MLTWFREHQHDGDYRMEDMYQIAGISRQGYFRAMQHEQSWSLYFQRLAETVTELRRDHRRMGARVMWHYLKIKEIGINKFEQFIADIGMGVAVTRKQTRTTDSRGAGLRFPNLTNGLKLTGVNQLVSSDITYFITPMQTWYIVLITDVYSMRLVGYSVSDNMLAIQNLKALERMFILRGQRIFKGIIHHSDKGSQYRCDAYLCKLIDAGSSISMADNCLQNPHAERINGIIKNDYLNFRPARSLSQLKSNLDWAIHMYNDKRPQKDLGYRTPTEYEQWIATLPMTQRPVRQLYDFNKKEDKQ